MTPATASASSWSGVELDRIRPHRPKSTRAFAWASAALASSTPAESTAGTVFGMSITVVTPPMAAARVRVPKSSLSGKPGSRLCTWTSIAPGSTYIPCASMRAAFSGIGPPASTRVITPSVTWTSASRGPSGPWTVPPLISSSVKFEVLNAEERRVRNAGVLYVFLASFLSIEDDDQVDDIRARVAQNLGRTQRVATGRHHVFDEGDAVPWREVAFDLLRGPITLRFLTHEDQRKPGLERDGPSEQDGAQLR